MASDFFKPLIAESLTHRSKADIGLTFGNSI